MDSKHLAKVEVGTIVGCAELHKRQVIALVHGTHDADGNADVTFERTLTEQHCTGTEMAAESGVLVIKNLPHGFFEQQLLGYFSQFGTVEYVRVTRSRASNLSCGIGYVKFEVPEVAPIAAESMDQYSMFGVTLKCQAKSVEWFKARPRLFQQRDAATCVKRKGEEGFVEEKDRRLDTRKRKAQQPTFTSFEAYVKRCHDMVVNDGLLAEKIRNAGIDYMYPPLKLSDELEAAWQKQEAAMPKVDERDDAKEEELEEMTDSSDEDVGSGN